LGLVVSHRAGSHHGAELATTTLFLDGQQFTE
jgi:hypothetical protein